MSTRAREQEGPDCWPNKHDKKHAIKPNPTERTHELHVALLKQLLGPQECNGKT
jgi:hypothetical protein